MPNSEDHTSVSAPEGLLSYSQREWKGNTTKSHLIRKVRMTGFVQMLEDDKLDLEGLLRGTLLYTVLDVSLHQPVLAFALIPCAVFFRDMKQ